MITCQRQAFSLPEDIHYLDNATLGPLPKRSEEAGIKALRLGRNPVDRLRSHFFEPVEKVRSSFAKMVNASTNNIAIIPSVSYGIATAAKNIRIERGDEVVVTQNQFPSNYFIWKELCDNNGAILKVIAPLEGLKSKSTLWNQAILNSITSKTKLVTMAHVHWMDGTLFDLENISKKCISNGAFLVIDGTQSIGALPFDIKKIQPDALVVASYKWLLGSYGLGFSYFSERMLEGSPLEINWINKKGSHNFESLTNYELEYRPGAARYSMGEQSSFISVAIAAESLELLNNWGSENIQQYCKKICQNGFNQLRSAGIKIENDEHRSFHISGIRLDHRWNFDEINKILKHQNIKVSQRGDVLRVSVNVYNDERDIDLLVQTILNCKKN